MNSIVIASRFSALLAGAHEFALELLRSRHAGTLIGAMALAGLAGVLKTFFL